MSKEKLITTVEEGFALNLDEGDCALTKSARPAWDEQVKLSQGSLPRAPVIKPTVFTCGPGPIKVTLHSEILGSLSFPPPISYSLHHRGYSVQDVLNPENGRGHAWLDPQAHSPLLSAPAEPF